MASRKDPTKKDEELNPRFYLKNPRNDPVLFPGLELSRRGQNKPISRALQLPGDRQAKTKQIQLVALSEICPPSALEDPGFMTWQFVPVPGLQTVSARPSGLSAEQKLLASFEGRLPQLRGRLQAVDMAIEVRFPQEKEAIKQVKAHIEAVLADEAQQLSLRGLAVDHTVKSEENKAYWMDVKGEFEERLREKMMQSPTKSGNRQMAEASGPASLRSGKVPNTEMPPLPRPTPRANNFSSEIDLENLHRYQQKTRANATPRGHEESFQRNGSRAVAVSPGEIAPTESPARRHYNSLPKIQTQVLPSIPERTIVDFLPSSAAQNKPLVSSPMHSARTHRRRHVQSNATPYQRHMSSSSSVVARGRRSSTNSNETSMSTLDRRLSLPQEFESVAHYRSLRRRLLLSTLHAERILTTKRLDRIELAIQKYGAMRNMEAAWKRTPEFKADAKDLIALPDPPKRPSLPESKVVTARLGRLGQKPVLSQTRTLALATAVLLPSPRGRNLSEVAHASSADAAPVEKRPNEADNSNNGRQLSRAASFAAGKVFDESHERQRSSATEISSSDEATVLAQSTGMVKDHPSMADHFASSPPQVLSSSPLGRRGNLQIDAPIESSSDASSRIIHPDDMEMEVNAFQNSHLDREIQRLQSSANGRGLLHRSHSSLDGTVQGTVAQSFQVPINNHLQGGLQTSQSFAGRVEPQHLRRRPQFSASVEDFFAQSTMSVGNGAPHIIIKPTKSAGRILGTSNPGHSSASAPQVTSLPTQAVRKTGSSSVLATSQTLRVTPGLLKTDDAVDEETSRIAKFRLLLQREWHVWDHTEKHLQLRREQMKDERARLLRLAKVIYATGMDGGRPQTSPTHGPFVRRAMPKLSQMRKGTAGAALAAMRARSRAGLAWMNGAALPAPTPGVAMMSGALPPATRPKHSLLPALTLHQRTDSAEVVRQQQARAQELGLGGRTHPTNASSSLMPPPPLPRGKKRDAASLGDSAKRPSPSTNADGTKAQKSRKTIKKPDDAQPARKTVKKSDKEDPRPSTPVKRPQAKKTYQPRTPTLIVVTDPDGNETWVKRGRGRPRKHPRSSSPSPSSPATPTAHTVEGAGPTTPAPRPADTSVLPSTPTPLAGFPNIEYCYDADTQTASFTASKSLAAAHAAAVAAAASTSAAQTSASASASGTTATAPTPSVSTTGAPTVDSNFLAPPAPSTARKTLADAVKERVRKKAHANGGQADAEGADMASLSDEAGSSSGPAKGKRARRDDDGDQGDDGFAPPAKKKKASGRKKTKKEKEMEMEKARAKETEMKKGKEMGKGEEGAA